jgi:thioredoxin 1
MCAAMPRVRFVWIDIEERPDVIGEMAIEAIPSLGVLRGDAAVHFGPCVPRREIVERLLRGLETADAHGPQVERETGAMLARALGAGAS